MDGVLNGDDMLPNWEGALPLRSSSLVFQYAEPVDVSSCTLEEIVCVSHCRPRPLEAAESASGR